MARKELDRFATNYKKDINIRTKLLVLIGVAVIVSCVTICFISLKVFNSGFIEQVVDNLHSTSNGAELMIKEKSSNVTKYAAYLADNERLKDALENNQIDSAKSELNNYFVACNVSFMFVTDSKGKILAGYGFGASNSGDVSNVKSVKSALNKITLVEVSGISNFNYAVFIAQPVVSDGKVLGTVIIGYDLASEDFVKQLNAHYNTEITIFKGDVRVASTLTDATGASVVGTSLDNKIIENTIMSGKNYSGKVNILKKSYYGYYSPIFSADNEITGIVFVAKNLESVTKVGNRTFRIVFVVMLITIVVLMYLSNYFVKWLMWRIQNVTNSLNEMATGEADLTKRCKLFIRDEIGFLVIKFDLFCDKMQQIISRIKNSKDDLDSVGYEMLDTARNTATAIEDIIHNIDGIQEQISSQGNSVHQTASSVNEISENIISLNSMIENQSIDVNQASTAVEQMVENIAEVNSNVDKMAVSFESLSENAKIGFSKQQDVNDRIKMIEGQSQMLQEANVVILSIAAQTNLLAMNAAIEAAHAGELGKGFSVVADEIRKLSETSSKQSKTIGEQLRKIIKSISQVVEASTESGNALTAVSSKIGETNQLVTMIKDAMAEQHAGSQRIVSVLKSMNESTVEVQKSSKEMSSRNEKILSEVNNLQSVTNVMKDDMESMSSSASKISDSRKMLKDLSERLQGSIDKIGAEIDTFKV